MRFLFVRRLKSDNLAGILLSYVLAMLCLRPIQAQFFTALNGRCNPERMYNYGTCRSHQCLDGETFLPGTSYCDVRSRALGTQIFRCVSSLPCCVWGGECRSACDSDERPLQFPSDCGPAGRGVCCMSSRQIKVALPPTGPQPLPLPPPQMNITQRQGTCRSNPVLSGRVLGGTQVPPEDWPWMIRLVYRGGQRALCSGVLVDPDTVLTVAHCVNATPPRDVQVQVGDFDLTRRERAEDLLPVSTIMTHRDFVMGSLGNDFAILKLSRSARLGPSVMPACLPDPRVALETGRNARCYMAGWGTDDNARGNPTLRAAPVVVIDTNLCQATLNSVIGTNQQLPPDVICTRGSTNPEAGACLFDDGGMLACADISGLYTFTGLVSQYSCGNLPTMYTRVDAYIPSILSRL
ncbi:hypothetical protein RRG08_021489 [Elysia crispata]|uniref:Peptidase S1 domain-containing protein n=1 Tax=Elysia crispata TaxID=231223 RepID=A0AAE1BD13_9GAST|nr:hypothetical protein RRG08_021489 [Elysia crispata]